MNGRVLHTYQNEMEENDLVKTYILIMTPFFVKSISYANFIFWYYKDFYRTLERLVLDSRDLAYF